MKKYLLLFIKGIAMGIANIIPGVSGGTIALITEIYEEFINSLKSFDLKALKMLLSFKIKEFIKYTNFYFLLAVLGGSTFSMISIAKILGGLFKENPISVWSFFFGLIAASVYYVGCRVKKWKLGSILFFIIGTGFAISLTFLSSSSVHNESLLYVFICGVVGVSGMLIPGLSGSFILILMGTYELLMIESLSNPINNIVILSIFILGSIVGLILFSHVIAWLLKYFKDYIFALLTGFILGSLIMIWPWQNCIKETTNINNTKITCLEYEKYIPELDLSLLPAVLLMLIGFYVVVKLESFSKNN